MHLRLGHFGGRELQQVVRVLFEAGNTCFYLPHDEVRGVTRGVRNTPTPAARR